MHAGQSGSQTAPAPAPALALVSSRADWVGLREPGSMRNITQNDLSVPSTGIQLGIEVSAACAQLLGRPVTCMVEMDLSHVRRSQPAKHGLPFGACVGGSQGPCLCACVWS